MKDWNVALKRSWNSFNGQKLVIKFSENRISWETDSVFDSLIARFMQIIFDCVIGLKTCVSTAKWSLCIDWDEVNWIHLRLKFDTIWYLFKWNFVSELINSAWSSTDRLNSFWIIIISKIEERCLATTSSERFLATGRLSHSKSLLPSVKSN